MKRKALKFLILNLMPNKIETENQWYDILSSLDIETNVTWLYTQSYESKHTSSDYLKTHYKTFQDVKNEDYDALIVTGAPVEKYAFESVKYWNELKEIMDHALKHYKSNLFVCWAAQAALYHYYNIDKKLHKKYFGIKKQNVNIAEHHLLENIQGEYYMPHSRFSSSEVDENSKVDVIMDNHDFGASLVMSKDGKTLCITGHIEYGEDTLSKEYQRDEKLGLLDSYEERSLNDEDRPWSEQGRILLKNWTEYYFE